MYGAEWISCWKIRMQDCGWLKTGRLRLVRDSAWTWGFECCLWRRLHALGGDAIKTRPTVKFLDKYYRLRSANVHEIVWSVPDDCSVRSRKKKNWGHMAHWIQEWWFWVQLYETSSHAWGYSIVIELHLLSIINKSTHLSVRPMYRRGVLDCDSDIQSCWCWSYPPRPEDSIGGLSYRDINTLSSHCRITKVCEERAFRVSLEILRYYVLLVIMREKPDSWRCIRPNIAAASGFSPLWGLEKRGTHLQTV